MSDLFWISWRQDSGVGGSKRTRLVTLRSRQLSRSQSRPDCALRPPRPPARSPSHFWSLMTPADRRSAILTWPRAIRTSGLLFVSTCAGARAVRLTGEPWVLGGARSWTRDLISASAGRARSLVHRRCNDDIKLDERPAAQKLNQARRPS